MPHRTLAFRPAALPVAAALACMVMAAPAAAQLRPYFLSATQAFTHDSNLFRDREGAERSDRISSTGLRVGIDQPIGRQRLLAYAGVRRNKFDEYSQLDNTEYDVNLRGDLSTVNRLSGSVWYTNSRSLVSFGSYTGTTVVRERNLQTLEDFGLKARLGGDARWVLEGGWSHRDQDYSSEAFRSREQTSDTVSLGVRYQPSDLLSLGVAGRATEGRTPEYRTTAGGEPVKDKIRRRDLDFTAVWVPTGLSTLSARLSLTSTDHSLAQQRDFDGVTGALTWAYRPTGKLGLRVELIRETNDQSQLAWLPDTLDDPANLTLTPFEDTRLLTTLKVAATWDATGKLRVKGNARYTHRNIKDAVVRDEAGRPVLASASGTDRTTALGFGVDYAITRAWLVGCNLGWEKRRVSDDGSQVSFPYEARTATCLAQLTLQ